MAELLGVVASGISIASIAIQVGDSVLKLKEFWDNINNAPEDIKYLIDELHPLSLILSDIGKSEKLGDLPPWSGILEGVVKELDEKIGKGKKIGGFKAALKKGVIERLKDRLRSAQFMLMLSNQTYYEALQRQRHEVQKQWSEAQQKELGELKVGVYRSTDIILSLQEKRTLPSNAISSEENDPPKDTEKNSTGPSSATKECKRLKRRSNAIIVAAKRQDEFRARIKVPSWLLFTNALDICYSRAVPGWKFSMTAYRIVPGDSELYRCVKGGDLMGLRKLFEQKKASPFDKIDLWGGYSTPYTLLQLAATHHRTEICQLLLLEGANAENLGISWAIDYAIYYGRSAKSSESYVDLVRLLLQANGDYDPLELYVQKSNLGDFWVGFITPSVLSWLLQRSSLSIQDLSLEQCAHFTLSICSVPRQRHMGTLARMLLKGRNIDASLCDIPLVSGQLLIHCIAQQLGYLFVDLLVGNCEDMLVEHWDPEKWPSEADNFDDFTPLQNLLGFAREILLAGSQLHLSALGRCGCRQFTPLLFFSGFFQNSVPNLERSKSLPNALISVKMWLRLLQASGIDLEQYGQKEKLVHATTKVCKRWYSPCWDSCASGYQVIFYRLISFESGPQPSDWKF